MSPLTITPIGIVHSCFKEKFGIPRQAGLITDATATLELLPPYNQEDALRGLEGFSHLWLLFIFHQNLRDSWKPTVRPPRLGGNQRMGVFATRSSFRPNPIGMSAVELAGISKNSGKLLLHLKGVDLLDGTPIIDIKPYLPYADQIPAATSGFAPDTPEATLAVEFSASALLACQMLERAGYANLRHLIHQILQSDPRPAYYTATTKKTEFILRLFDLAITWRVVTPDKAIVSIIQPESDATLAVE